MPSTGPAPSQHDDLLPQHQDLGFHRRARPEQVDNKPDDKIAEIHHPAEDHPILRLAPTGWNLRQGQLSEAGVALGQAYPSPIVDHTLARNAALAGYQQVRLARS